MYQVKPRKDGRDDLCPVCNAQLAYCHICEYCSDLRCGYADGYFLPKKDDNIEKIKDKLVIK